MPSAIGADAWGQNQELTATDGMTGDFFGWSVALSADGATALIGAQSASVNSVPQGAAYVFTRSGSVWTQQQELTAIDGTGVDAFGQSVALSADGSTALIGAPGKDIPNLHGNYSQGAAYVFTRSGSSWTQQQELTATDGMTDDLFGRSVALSADGSTVLVGAAYKTVNGNFDQGAAYVFARDGTSWTQQQELTAADGTPNDSFGSSVALSADGSTALIGKSALSAAAAYIFTRSGSSWDQQQEFTGAVSPSYRSFVNYSVALSADGNTALIGASFNTVGGNEDQGAAYIFTRSGSSWTQQQELTATDGAYSDGFGSSVALSADGSVALIGASNRAIGSNPNVHQGAAYVFTRSGSVWTQQQELTATDAAAGSGFGNSGALDTNGATALVVAPGPFFTPGLSATLGRAYVYSGMPSGVTPTPTPGGPPITVTPTPTPPLPASADTGFRPSLDGFGFHNKSWGPDPQDPQNGNDSLVEQSGPMFVQEFGGPSRDASLIESYLDAGKAGSCYGFAMASGIAFLGLPQLNAGVYFIPRTGQPLAVQTETGQLGQSIAFYQGSWVSEQVQRLTSQGQNAPVEATMAQIESEIAAGRPVGVVLMHADTLTSSLNAHQVLAYRYAHDTYAGEPSVAVFVYDPNKPGEDTAKIEFWQDSTNTWHWSYFMGLSNGTAILYGGPIHYCPSGHCGSDPAIAAIPLAIATQRGIVPSHAGTRPQSVASGSLHTLDSASSSTYLIYAGTQSLTVTDALGQSSTIDANGNPTSGIPGISPAIPSDASALPSAGMLYIPETGAFTVTAAPTASGTVAFDLAGPTGSAQLTETGASTGQPLTATLSADARTLSFGTAGVSGAQAAFTLNQTGATTLHSFTVSGLDAADAGAYVAQVSPDQQSLTLSSPSINAPFALDAIQEDMTGAISSTALTTLTIAPGVSETVAPDWATPSAPVTVTMADVSGQITQTAVIPDAPLQVGVGQIAAPGDTVPVTATNGIFLPDEALTILAAGLLAPQAGVASATGGAALTVTVPATATTGTYVMTLSGTQSTARASGNLVVVAPNEGPSIMATPKMPTLTLNPSAGTPGTQVMITSTPGFSPTEMVDLSLNGVTLGMVSAAADGSVAGSFTIPSDASTSAIVTAIGEFSGMSATAPVTVLAPPASPTPTNIATVVPPTMTPPPPPYVPPVAPPATSVPPRPVPPTAAPPASSPTPAPHPIQPVVPPSPPPPPTSSVQRATPTATVPLCASHTAPLSVRLDRRTIYEGDTLALQVRGAGHAHVQEVLQITATKTVLSGHGRRRKHIRRTIVLYRLDSHGVADAHGRFMRPLHVTYHPAQTVQAGLTVTEIAGCAHGSITERVRIQPLLTLHLGQHRIAGGHTLVVQVNTAPHAHVSVLLQVVKTVVHSTGQGRKRRRVAQSGVLYHVVTKGLADAHGHFRGTVRVSYHVTRASQAALTVTVTAPEGHARTTTSLLITPPAGTRGPSI